LFGLAQDPGRDLATVLENSYIDGPFQSESQDEFFLYSSVDQQEVYKHSLKTKNCMGKITVLGKTQNLHK
jgi:hypothetical protein